MKNNYDVAIIGGGPAGIMAAIQAARAAGPEGVPFGSRRVVLLEKNSKLGKKLLLTGGGRCNFANAEFNLKKLVENYHNGEFLFHAFSVFGPKETIIFFNKLGVESKTENNNRVFPKSDKAQDVLEALKKELEKNKVEIIYNSEVIDVEAKNKKIVNLVTKSGERVSAAKYILATGGKSYPQTGSDGFGYKLSEKLGHSIVKLSPALAPILLKENWVKDLQGISLKNIKINGEAGDPPSLKASEGQELMFTQNGISGPAVLNISARVGELIEKSSYAKASEDKIKIILDLFPDLNQEEVLKSFEEILKKYPKQSIKNILSVLMPEHLAEVLLNSKRLEKSKIGNNMSRAEKEKIVKLLKNIEMTAQGVASEAAMVTRGGVSLKEIDHKTMQSKIIDNLYFAGEIIDIDGKTGGFNLQMCWTTGFIAGSK